MADQTQTLGRYQLLALLATGGMAEIYLARQKGIQGFERLVVVKRILPHLRHEKKFLDMFFDEARIAAQLNHPNIVQIFDLGQDGDDFFVAMEYLEGESLGYLVAEARRNRHVLTQGLAAGITGLVCDGLACAHNLHDDHGKPLHVVHRDVSPQNIIILFSGAVKLVDFGIAKAATKIHQTRVGTLKGKLAYMSPEQCLSNPVDSRSDIFSLGVVLWELLTRRRLFKRDQEAAIINAILHEEYPRVREVNPDVSTALEGIVMRALQKDPEDRYQDVTEMGMALREFIRENGLAAGAHDIASFCQKVFAERARTKRRLLEDIRAGGTGRFALSVLKPETDESFPSHSGVSDRKSKSVDIDVAEPLSEELEEHPTRRVAPLAEQLAEQAGQGAAGQQAAEVPTGGQADEEPSGELPTKREKSPLTGGDEKSAPGMDPEATEITDEQQTVRSARPLEKEVPTEEPAGEPGSARNRMVLLALPMAAIIVLVIWALLPGESGSPGKEVDGKVGPGKTPVVDAGGPAADAGSQGGPVTGSAVSDAKNAHGERDGASTPRDAGSPGGDAGPAGKPAGADVVEKKPQPQPEPLRLSVDSRPRGCRVEIDSRRVDGRTPLADLEIEAGIRHSVLVRCPRHKPQTKLVPEDAGPRLALSFDPQPRRTRPRKSTGFLRLDTAPWSEVHLGKRKLGITPLLGIKLPAGRHRLRLSNPQMGIDKTISVTIRPGKTSKIFRKLKP